MQLRRFLSWLLVTALSLSCANMAVSSASDPADINPPVVVITSPTLDVVSGNVEVRATVTDQNLRHYWYQIKNGDTVITEKTVLSSGITNQLIHVLTEEGTYTITMAARDKVGGTSTSGNRSQTVAKTVKIDRTAPIAVITSPTKNFTNGDVEVRATVTDQNLRHYWYQIKKDGVVLVEQTVLSTGITNQLLQTLTENGVYTISVAARDKAGGTASSGNRSVTVTNGTAIDKIKPIASIVSPTLSATNGDTEVRATVSDEYLQDYRFVIKRDGDIVTNTVVVDSGITNELLSTLTDDGVYEITLTARDKAGNESMPVTKTVTIDKTAPVVQLANITQVTEGHAVEVNGTVDDPSVTTVQLYVDGEVSGDPIAVTNGTFSYSIPALASGSHSVTASAKDAVGNEGINPAVIAIVNAAVAVVVPPIVPAVPSQPVTPAPLPGGTQAPATEIVASTRSGASANSASATQGDENANGQALGTSYPDHAVENAEKTLPSAIGNSADKSPTSSAAFIASAQDSSLRMRYWWLLTVPIIIAGFLFTARLRRKKSD